MTKCTPEEAAAMAEKAGLRSWDNRKNITLDQRTARLIDRAREPLQAKIDALMLEHCSEEMTPKQIAEWAKHQRPINAAARLEVLERKHTEFFDRWHDERRKREAVELERDALAAQVSELREALIYHQEQTRPIFQTDEALARTAPAAADGETT